MITSIANSLGFGSGIDTPRLVNDLANASRAPKVQRLDGLARAVQTKISALAQARADLDSFSTSLASVSRQDSLRTQPTVSNADVLSAVALPGARLGGLSAEIEVTRLARSQTSYSGFVTNAADPIGQGGMTLSVGGQNFAIAIDNTNDSLNGLAAAINAAGAGVTASIVTDTGGARLVLKGETGAAKAFTLAADAGAAAGLSQFTTANMTTGQPAQDADFTVDGVAFARPTNSFSDVIPGVTLTLKAERPGTPISLGAQRPSTALRETIDDFVSVFNEMKTNIGEARTASSGAAAIRALEQQLGQLVGKSVTSHPTINSLSDIGVKTNRDGTISLDSAKFDAVLAADPDAVEAIFAPTRDATRTEATDPGISGALDQIKTASTGANGPLETLRKRFQTEADAITKDREKMEAREDAYRARLERQFGDMEGRIGALRATQTYLEQQIKLWTNDRS
jgi:flagellar hook-associated protein 2